MDLLKATSPWMKIIVITGLIITGSCTQQKPEQPGAETTISQKVDEKTIKKTLEKQPTKVTGKIDELFVELRKHQSDLRAREQTLEKITKELDAKNASLSNRNHELRLKEIELLERENQLEKEKNRLKAQERFSFLVLGFGVVLILFGGLMLTVCMKQKSRFKTTKKKKISEKDTNRTDSKKQNDNL